MPTQLSDMLVFLRKRKGLSQQELSDLINIKRSTIGMYETGKREPDLETLEIFADFYNVDMNTLTGREQKSSFDYDFEKQAIHVHTIPILGRVAAGLPLYAEEHIIGYTVTNLNGGNEYFALQVQGDSMNALGINDGDNIVVRKQDYADNGQVAVVLVDDQDATIKRFYKQDDSITLVPQSTNPVHLPQIYNTKQTAIRIIGIVVQSVTDII